jgi:hypothetical protein
MLGCHVKAVDVVEHAVPRLANHGQPPDHRSPSGGHVVQQGIAHDAHAVGVGDRHRGGEQPRLAYPLEAGHLAVAVESMGPREHGKRPHVVRRQDDGHPGAHGAVTDLERPRALDEGRMPDPHVGDVGDRILRAGCPLADDDPMVSRAHAAEH